MEMKFLRSTTRCKAIAVKKAVKEKEVRSLIRAACTAEHVDLAFIVDGTGSMSSHIAAVKRSILDIFDRIRRTNGNLNLRLAVVVYRDLGDSHRHEILEFTSHIASFERFVGSIVAKGEEHPRTWPAVFRKVLEPPNKSCLCDRRCALSRSDLPQFG